MQERRTTIRTPFRQRAQYCPTDDLLPRDGQLVDLSERGAGLVTHETHPAGRQIAVSFTLPGEAEPVTATGSVRWTQQALLMRGRHRVGLEWTGVDENTHHRLHNYLNARTQATQPARRRTSWLPAGWWRSTLVWAGIAAVAILYVFWIRLMRQQERALSQTVQEQEATLQRYTQRERALRAQLSQARENLVTTTTEVARLDQQAQALGAQMQTLGVDVERFQQSYVKIQEERGELMDQRNQLLQRVIDLEGERSELMRRLISPQALDLAIREAISTRQSAARKNQRQQDILAAPWLGNQGYVVRAGQSTLGKAVVRIRVHDPETVWEAAPGPTPAAESPSAPADDAAL